jgi:DNA-binding transcriptional LysR family regulator
LRTKSALRYLREARGQSRMTDAGTDYLTRIEAILSALDEADHVARGTAEPRSHLRVALSASFGVCEVSR